ncbi:MAG TPA: hypothetical protein V6C78_11640 [Crinalium sp.]|jgi:hypothetical protein
MDVNVSDIIGQWAYWDPISFEQYSQGAMVKTITTDDGMVRPGFPYSLIREDLPDPNPNTPSIELFDRPQYEWELPHTVTGHAAGSLCQSDYSS